MNTVLLFGSVVIISLISLIGVFTLSLKQAFLKRIVLLLVSLAAGTLLGDVFLHILPELMHEADDFETVSFFIIGGILFFLILEKFLHWRHCHHQSNEQNHEHPLAITNLVADGIHNFLDGIIIALAFSVSIEVGIATAIAVALHEIPQEIGDFGVLIHAGMKTKKALLLNFASALFAVIGALFGLVIGSVAENAVPYLLAVAAGGFIYIAMSDLFPEIKHEDDTKKNILQFVFVLIGIFIMVLVGFVEPHSHGEEDNHDGDEETVLQEVHSELEDEHEDE